MSEPSPLVIVSRHGDFAGPIGRARVLLDEEGTVLEVDPGASDALESLAVPFERVGGEAAIHIVYLVGDLDPAETVDVEGLVRDAADFVEALKMRFPPARARVWFLVRVGIEIGPAELDLIRAVEGSSRDFAFAALLLVTASSGAALAHPSEIVDRQIGDLLHLIASSDLEAAATQTGRRTWAVGVGSVVYRPEGLLMAVVRAIDAELARLADGTLRDPARSAGTGWVDDHHLGPPRPGEERDDVELKAILAGPGRGSLADDPARDLRQLDVDLEAVDPGLWAGKIAAAIDVATAPRTDPERPERSPLVIACDQVEANLAARRSQLRSALEGEARRILEEQRTLPSADGWCEGARAAIQGTIEDLRLEEPPEGPDLRESYLRLFGAARKLPYSSSLLVRGLFLVVLMLVLGYVYAPVGTFVAWAFSKRVFWFGDTLEDNARTWARITAAATGVLLWIWWESRWRRVRRFRRQYVRSAEERMRLMVERVAWEGRLALLEDLRDFIGDPGAPGTLRGWLAVHAEALRRVRARAASAAEDAQALEQDRWSVVIPSADEPARILDDMDGERRIALPEHPLEAMVGSALAIEEAEAEANLIASIDEALPRTGRNLEGHWQDEESIDGAAREALSAALWPGLPGEMAALREVVKHQALVASAPLRPVLQSLVDPDQHIACDDPNIAANLWMTPVIVPASGEEEAT